MKRTIIPLAVFIVLVVVLGVGLTLNPREVPSPLIGKAIPAFELPLLSDPAQTVDQQALLGKVSMLNFWATWCAGCLVEHPLLVRVAREGTVPIYGINYKDERLPALAWLRERGDPYLASIEDRAGSLGIDFGVYGLPETFIIDQKGQIAYKHIGPISEEIWQQKLMPVIARLNGKAP